MTKSVAGSEEVLLQTLKKAGAGNVTVELLASMGTANRTTATPTRAWLSYYAPSTSAKTQLITIPKSQAQTVNPSAARGHVRLQTRRARSASSARSTTSARATCGRRTARTRGSPTPTSSRKVRFFPLKDRNGNIVANAYVFAFEEYDQETDQNDIVGIIRNVHAGRGFAGRDACRTPTACRSTTAWCFSRIRTVDPVVGN